jgi:cathepsin X
MTLACHTWRAATIATRDFVAVLNTSCGSHNICRTCSTFSSKGGTCKEIDFFPNATVAEYGSINLLSLDRVHKIKAEIYSRGPVAAGINAMPILKYKGGVIKTGGLIDMLVDHIVSIVGWGVDKEGDEYWIVRNSWGQYWGEMGFVRVKTGSNLLGIESTVAWATSGQFTVANNFACGEGGEGCGDDDLPHKTHLYADPSADIEAVQRKLRLEESYN